LGAECFNLSGTFTSDVNLKIFELPESVTYLDVSDIALYALVIPSQVKTLYARGFSGQSLTGLPSTLKQLDVSNSNLQVLGTLPAGLDVINIRQCNFSTTDLNRLVDEFVVGVVPSVAKKKSWNSQSQNSNSQPSKRDLLDANVTNVSC